MKIQPRNKSMSGVQNWLLTKGAKDGKESGKEN